MPRQHTNLASKSDRKSLDVLKRRSVHLQHLFPGFLPAMRVTLVKRVAGSLGAAAAFVLAIAAPAAERQSLRGHVPLAAAHLRPLGRLSGTNHLDLAISLPLRNREALTNLLEQIYNPASPNYHHYLTPEQFAQQFGPTEQDYQAAVAFAKAQGFTVTGLHPNRTLVDVSGTVATAERAFHLHMQRYQHPMEARTFYAPDVEPTLDLAVPALAINGLDNYILPRPMNLRTGSFGLLADATNNAAPAATAYTTGSGPRGTFIGKDFRAAYAPGVTLNGAGQTVGLLEFDNYFPGDITAYERLAALPAVPLTNVLVDGFHNSPGINNKEVALDIDMAVCMAPGLSRIIVYEGKFSLPNDILNRMATDNLARQLSSSWGYGLQVDSTREQIFQQFAAQGQTMLQAAGDLGAWVGPIFPPSDDALLTVVGGTSLTTGAGGAWSSETAWQDGGGGISTSYPIPNWQQGVSMSASQGSTTMRNIPDVAALADTVIWLVANNGQQGSVGGTSAAAPMWAGIAALANQQAAAAGRPAIGFLNPTLSLIGQGSGYAASFHDIATGNNTTADSPTKFFAVPGYDLCAGWGTPTGSNLISALVFPPDALLVTPAAGVTAVGPVGGPFTPASQNYSLSTFGPAPINWILAGTSPWLNVPVTNGTVASNTPPGTVTVSLNAAASNLVAGSYTATLWFTNLNDGFAQSRQFNLAVITPPVITVQPSNVTALPGATATFTVGTASNAQLFYQWRQNGSDLTDAANFSGSTTSTLRVANVSSANIAGYSVVVSNALGAATSSVATLGVVTVTGNGVTMSTLNSFSGGNDGGNPNGLVETADGNFFGMTQNGGLDGYGTLFQMDADGTITVLHSFTGGNDGGHPQDALVQGPNGSFYGTTFDGGLYGNGTVFNATSNGFPNTLFPFNVTNGDLPFAGVTLSSDGNFYGTTYQGGPAASGTIYRITPAGQLTTLYTFTGGVDGGSAYAGLTQGIDGSLYGTTFAGGTVNGGTVFNITTNGAFTGLFSFAGTNGAFPYAGLVQDENGTFYGVASGGGSHNAGTIFKRVNGGKLTNIYSFTGGSDGAQPAGGLLLGADGNLYGTTASGGNYGDGTVFRITRDGTFTNLLQFDGYNGANPSAALTQGADGNLYGTTQNGGQGGAGTIFRLGLPDGLQILTQPADQTVFSGSTVVLSVVTLGAEPMTFRWQMNGTDLFDGGNVSGSGTRVLTISNASPANVAYYSVLVRNAVGLAAFSDSAILEVLVAPPIITAQPTNQTLPPGATATFNVAVIGSQPMTYQWRTIATNAAFGGGVFLGGGPVNLVDGGNISGSTTSTLTIANAIEANNAFYSVVVSNPVTSVTSTMALLNVIPPSTAGTRLATLHSFLGGTDGSKPSVLTLGNDGNLYGTTEFGGTFHAGSVFMVTTNGIVTNLVSFNGTTGFGPTGGVVQGPDGNFYGTTQFGGTNDSGNVFMMTPVQIQYSLNSNGLLVAGLSSTLSNFYSFTGGADGNAPVAPLIRGTDGNLYGTTEFGGDFGLGNVFKISTNGTITNLYSLTGGVDSSVPTNALMQTADGNFYGVTQSGGSNSFGSVFRLTPAGAFSTVYSFTGGADGKFPNGPLVQSLDGSLYGTTRHNKFNGFEFYGVVFKVTTNGAFTKLYMLNSGDGHYPAAGLLQGSDGIFYGTGEFGGTDNNNGAVFYTTPGGTTATLVNFDGFDDGANPETPLVLGADGALYGTTSSGGQFGHGAVYRLAVPMRPLLVPGPRTGTNLTFTWNTVAGRMYQVQASTNLNFNNWTNSGAAFPAPGATVTITNSTITNGQRYFRVMIVP